MTRDEVKKIFALFKTAYRGFLPDDDDEVKVMLNLWEMMFVRNSYAECEWAAKRCIETCIYPPTIADMKGWLGTERTLQDAQALLPYHYEEPKYANEAYMESKFEALMRAINEIPSEERKRDGKNSDGAKENLQGNR